MFSNTKLLILGGNNYLGVYLLKTLNSYLSNITLLNRGIKPNPNNVDIIHADRNNRDEMCQALLGKYFDYIFDFSGYNKNSISNVISFCSFKHYIFVSSTAVYKQVRNCKPNESFTFCNLNENSYGFNKWQAENEIIENSTSKQYYFYIFRPVYIYGLNDPNSRELLIFNQILNGKVNIIGNGQNLVQFIYITDFIKILLLLVEKKTNIIANIASNEFITIKEYINLCSNILSRSHLQFNYIANCKEIDYKSYTPFTGFDRVADVSLLLKYYANFTCLREGLKETYEYYKSNSIIL